MKNFKQKKAIAFAILLSLTLAIFSGCGENVVTNVSSNPPNVESVANLDELKSEISNKFLQADKESEPYGIKKLSATYLSWAEVATNAEVGTDYFVDASGNLEIHTAAGLAYFASQVNNGNAYEDKKVRLTSNIDLATAGVANYNGDIDNVGDLKNVTSQNSWVPIGNLDRKFKGAFDGENHKISGVYINTTDTDNNIYVGLFGCVFEGSVENISVVKSHITASTTGNAKKAYVAGVVGFGKCTVSNCSFDGSVAGKSTTKIAYVGGVVGYCSADAEVLNCYNKGDVFAVGDEAIISGIAGYCYTTPIVNCHNSGDVCGSGNVVKIGGVAGDNYSSTITNCFNIGEVSSESDGANIGGVVGNEFYGRALNCFNTGLVHSNNNSAVVGGVVGQNKSYRAIVENCYAFYDENKTLSGNENLIGNGTTSEDRVKNNATFNSFGELSNVVACGENEKEYKTLVSSLNAYAVSSNKENAEDDGYANLELWEISNDENDGFAIGNSPCVFSKDVAAIMPTIIIDQYPPIIMIDGEIATITDLNLEKVTVAGKEIEVTSNEMKVSLSGYQSGEHEIVAIDRYGRTEAETFVVEKVELPEVTEKPEATITPEITQKPTVPQETEVPGINQTDKEKSSAGIWVALGVLAIASSGAGYYFVKVKGKK